MKRAAMIDTLLSAEPLVGLKLRLVAWGWGALPAFSRTPRGFEASGPGNYSGRRRRFQPNPSWD